MIATAMSRHAEHGGIAYRPDIDGLRGAAILAVLLSHVDPRLLPGGYVGVDVFFVISGFLITSIIRRDNAHHSFTFAGFYARRIRRLVPAATIMVAAITVTGAFFCFPKDFQDLGKSAVAYAAMLSNVLFWRWDDYFAGQNRAWPLLHTWSLSVEEQFYLVYPLLLWGIRRWSMPRTAALLAALAAASLLLSVFQTAHAPRSAYYLLPSRSWELLVGALCTFLTWPVAFRLLGNALGICAGGMVVGSMLFLTERTPFPGLAALVPVSGTAMLLVLGTHRDNLMHRLLSMKWLVFTGTISYSLYLWHWPLLVYARYPWSATPAATPLLPAYLAAVLAFGVAWLSYRYIEGPGRRIQIGNVFVLLSGLAVAALIAITGMTIHRAAGLPDRFPPHTLALIAAATDDNPRRPDIIDRTANDIRAGTIGLLGIRERAATPAFTLWGDSHADAISPLFDAAAREIGVTGWALAHGATPPLVQTAVAETGPRRYVDYDFTIAAAEAIAERRIRDVVLVAVWSKYESRCSAQSDELPNGDECDGLARALRRTIDFLQSHGTERVWIAREVPTQPFDVPRHLAFSSLRGKPLPTGLTQAEYTQAVSRVDDALRSCTSDSVFLIDLPSTYYATAHGLLTTSGAPFYCDNHHISTTGALALRPALDHFLQTIRRVHANSDRIR